MAILLVLLLLIYGRLFSMSPSSSLEDEVYQMRIVPLFGEKGIELLYQPKPEPMQFTLNLPSAYASYLTVAEESDHVTVMTNKGYTGLLGKRPIMLTSIIVSRDLETPEKDYPLVQYGTLAAVYDEAQFNVIKINNQNVAQAPEAHRYHWVKHKDIPAEGAIILDNGFVVYFDRVLNNKEQLSLLAGIESVANYMINKAGPIGSPEMMILYEQGKEGVLRIEGDTLDNQIVLKIAGGALKTEPEISTSKILRTLSHEITHLWQLNVEDNASAPDWLHEGLAEALALENLYLSEVFDDNQYTEMFSELQDECARELKNGKLSLAATRQDHRASYACGAIIWATLAAQKQGSTILDAWQAWIGYCEQHHMDQGAQNFYKFVEHYSGKNSFATSVQNFVSSDYSGADGAQIIERLFNRVL